MANITANEIFEKIYPLIQELKKGIHNEDTTIIVNYEIHHDCLTNNDTLQINDL